MDKRELLDRFAGDAEERVTLSQVLDRMESARLRQSPACTAFLSPRERMAAEQMLLAAGSGPYLPLGGYPEAERQVLLFLPDWLEPELAAPEEYLSLLRLTWYQEDRLTHRDILGALMGLGIRRDTVGDILVSGESCDFVVLPSVAPYLKDNLCQAGRVKLRVQPVPLEDIRVPVQERKLLHDTVAALRLDSVLAVGFSLSRSKAAQLIAAGRCAVNWQETARTDLTVKEGDVISCRGLGKCRLARVGDLSRKGRINITMERYL